MVRPLELLDFLIAGTRQFPDILRAHRIRIVSVPGEGRGWQNLHYRLSHLAHCIIQISQIGFGAAKQLKNLSSQLFAGFITFVRLEFPEQVRNEFKVPLRLQDFELVKLQFISAFLRVSLHKLVGIFQGPIIIPLFFGSSDCDATIPLGDSPWFAHGFLRGCA
ncbi:MAG: hypothetical protein ABIM40_05340 [Pseudomonadota bacterium]